jgi:cytochrome c-type biogenesis protein CcmF
LLAIGAFSLSLLGTFLVRSGIIESVHAFASDPSRGLFILIFLAVCVGGALALYAWRAPLFRSDAGFAPVSRESFLLLNNVLLVAATALILLGTLYPVFLDALNLGKITVGPPYFLVAFLIPVLPMLLLLAPGMHASWKRAKFERTKLLLALLFVVALVLGIAVPWAIYGWHSALTAVGIAAALWIAASSCIEPISRWRQGHKLTGSVVGMSVAHFGLAVFILGATTVDSYKKEADISLRPGEASVVSGYRFQLNSLRDVKGPNYDAVEAEIEVSHDGKPVTVLHPQKRVYRVQASAMSEAGIQARWDRDLFVAMGESLGNNAWSLRLQHKPLVRFIWLGALIMALGGFIAVCDRRYRQTVRDTATVPTAAGTERA